MNQLTISLKFTSMGTHIFKEGDRWISREWISRAKIVFEFVWQEICSISERNWEDRGSKQGMKVDEAACQ